MDQLDQAQAFEEQHHAAALAARYRPPELSITIPVPDFKECDECGEEIPQARLKIYPSACRCTECQAQHENRQARIR